MLLHVCNLKCPAEPGKLPSFIFDSILIHLNVLQFYNMWLSLGGALLCVAIMILISWWTAVITLAVVLALYLIVAHRKPGELHFRREWFGRGDFRISLTLPFRFRCKLGLDDAGANVQERADVDHPAKQRGGTREELQAADSGAERNAEQPTSADRLRVLADEESLAPDLRSRD